VYVEWPLGKSLPEARELLRLKNEGGVKHAVVGLQARQAPIIKKLKELADGGRIGKVLSSTWVSQGGSYGEMVAQGTEYLGQKKYGGNLVTIRFGHEFDFFQQGIIVILNVLINEKANIKLVLGSGFKSKHAVIANRRPLIKLVDNLTDANKISDFVKDTEDTVMLVGTLANGVPFSWSLRGARPFKGTPGMDWRIYGEKGEIRATAYESFLPMGDNTQKIEVHDFESDSVEEIEIPVDEVDALPMNARNVGRVYRAFANGEISCNFEDAVDRHQLIDEVYRENGYFEG